MGEERSPTFQEGKGNDKTDHINYEPQLDHRAYQAVVVAVIVGVIVIVIILNLNNVVSIWILCYFFLFFHIQVGDIKLKK